MRRNAALVRGGFTLLEVMIVIVIILAIAGLVTVNLMSSKDSATNKTVQVQMTAIRDSLKQFNFEFNRYPTDEEGVAVLWDKEKLSAEADAAKWRMFTEQAIPNDAWGKPWVYRQVGEKAPTGMFDLMSFGPDGEEGTADDLNVWGKSVGENADDGGPPPAGPGPSSGGSRPNGGG